MRMKCCLARAKRLAAIQASPACLAVFSHLNPRLKCTVALSGIMDITDNSDMDADEPGPSNATLLDLRPMAFHTADKYDMDVDYSEPGPGNATHLDLRPLSIFTADSEAEEFDSDEYDEQAYDAYSEYDHGGTPQDNDGGLEDAEDESLLDSCNTEAPSDLQQCLDANRAYQEFLGIAIGELTEALKKNRQLQKELPERLAERTRRRGKPKVRKNWYQSLIFHHPYFRDLNGMPAPPNEDELTKRANKELDPYITPATPWLAEECHSLVTAVQSNLLQQSLEALMDRKETLSERLLTTDDSAQNAELKDRIRQLEEQMTEVRGMSLVELLEQSTRSIDWLRIAAVDMRSNRTAFSCEMHWRHLLDVRLNQGAWTPAEEDRLCTLVTKWDERCWDEVAKELKTGRSAFQCALQYCKRHATRLNIGPFTPEEDERLKMLINYCTEGDNISWSQVAHYMGTRSKQQVKNRYLRSMDPHMLHGRWSAPEDMMLLIAIKLFGSEGWTKSDSKSQGPPVASHPLSPKYGEGDFPLSTVLPANQGGGAADAATSRMTPRNVLIGADTPKNTPFLELLNTDASAPRAVPAVTDIRITSMVASLLPNRTSNQCREHYVNNFAYDIVTGPYTPLEDKTLVELVEKHGLGCWAQVSKGMPWRTANSVLIRYRRLSQMLRKDKLTVADLENYQKAPLAPAASSRRGQVSSADRRFDIYRRVCRMINTSTQREAALKLVKGENQTVDRDACLRLYQRMLAQFRSGHNTSYGPVQAKSLNKAIAQYAQTVYRPFCPNMTAYEHQEWQAMNNVLHDLHGLERPPGRPELKEVDTVPFFEDFVRTSVVGVPAEFEPGQSHLPPLLPPNETSMATFGRLVDRFADGDLGKCWSFLQDYTSFPELSAALDAVNVESVRCTDCTSRALLEGELSVAANRELAPNPDQLACHRCKQLQETRRNYDVLCGRFISTFFWPLLVDEQNVVDTVQLAPCTRPKGPKVQHIRKKMKKPWVKEAWVQRKLLAAQAAAAARCEQSQGGQEVDNGGEAVAEGADDRAMPSTSRGENSHENMVVDEGSSEGAIPSAS